MLLRRPASGSPLLLLVFVALTFGVAAHARADEQQLTLSYRAPLECPSAEAMLRAVRRLTDARSKPYSASIVIEQEQGRFIAHLSSNDGAERQLEGNSCDEVAEASAVVLALAISPSSRPPRNAVKNGMHETTASGANPSRQHSNHRVKFKLGAAAVFDVGTMPGLDWALGARAGVTARTWSASLEGMYWLRPERETLSQSPATGGDFSWWSLSGSGCIAAKDGLPRIEFCGGPELGHLAGRGFGLPTAQDAASFRLGFQATSEIQLPVSGHIRLRGGLGIAAVVLGRHAFYINGAELYRPGLLAGRAQLGVDVIF